MRINKLNYEVYAIDYIDGTLSPDLKIEMEQFLLIHPDVAKDVALFGDMAFVPDQSVKYLGKQDLKRSMQFAIMDYMNWIVPICMSVAFMVAYPYIRTLWHADETVNIPAQENVQQEVSIENNHPAITALDVSKVNDENNNNENEVLNNNLNPSDNTVTSNYSNSTTTQSSIRFNDVTHSSIDQHQLNANGANANIIFKEESPNDLAEELENGDIISDVLNNNNEDITGNQAAEYEGQSIVDFGYNVIAAEEEVNFLSAYPNELSLDYVLNTSEVENLIIREPKLLGYVTFSVQPYSLGFDMAKTTNITANNELVRALPVEGVGGSGEIVVGEPKQAGIDVEYHISELVKFGSGFKITNRNISYRPLNTSSTALDIQYRTYSVPAMATLKMPVGDKENALHFSGGVALNWMGERNYKLVNHSGNPDLEAVGTASLFDVNGNNKLVTTNDAFRMVAVMQFGLAYHKNLNQYGGLTFGIEYSRQMSNINVIRIYDYDMDTQFRSNGTLYNMRFETVNASVKYTLPYKWRLTTTNNKNRS